MQCVIGKRMLIVLLASGFAILASCSKKTPDKFTTHAGTKIYYETYSSGFGHGTERYGRIWTETGSKVFDHLTGCAPYVLFVKNSNYVIASDDTSGKHPTVYFVDVVSGTSFSSEIRESGLGIGCDSLCSAEQTSPNQITITVSAFGGGASEDVFDIVAKKHVSRRIR
ncbi:MAG: hypothetical protein U0640_02075 [Phycisphaerales bacterium]